MTSHLVQPNNNWGHLMYYYYSNKVQFIPGLRLFLSCKGVGVFIQVSTGCNVDNLEFILQTHVPVKVCHKSHCVLKALPQLLKFILGSWPNVGPRLFSTILTRFSGASASMSTSWSWSDCWAASAVSGWRHGPSAT